MASELNASQLFSFLTQLAANNNREWFKQHKDQYDTLRQQWLGDVQSLIDLISQWDDSVHGLNVADAVYRIYRDIRFSPDKSPYKTYFSACFGRGSGGRHGKKPNTGILCFRRLRRKPGNEARF